MGILALRQRVNRLEKDSPKSPHVALGVLAGVVAPAIVLRHWRARDLDSNFRGFVIGNRVESPVGLGV